MVAGNTGVEMGQGRKKIFLAFFCSRKCKEGFQSHGLLKLGNNVYERVLSGETVLSV